MCSNKFIVLTSSRTRRAIKISSIVFIDDKGAGGRKIFLKKNQCTTTFIARESFEEVMKLIEDEKEN